MSDLFEVHFGGPDQPPRRLRNVLLEKVERTPAGGAIDWLTYYFRDRELARALIKARQRGARVRVTLAAKPRIAAANESVIRLLRADDGLGPDLTLVNIAGLPAVAGRSRRPQLHAKLYCFSHPDPVAYIGSFNPSGDAPEQHPEIIHEIGDQDRGHNLLVGIKDATLARHLRDHARRLHADPPGLLYRFRRVADHDILCGDTRLYFWPRLTSHPVPALLERFARGAKVRIAASHIRSLAAARRIGALAGRGAAVEIIADATRRRVTPAAERILSAAGARFRRLRHAESTPMHLKFVLAQTDSRYWSVFGSYNWTLPSFWLNHEIAAVTENADLFHALRQRWQYLKNLCD